MISVDNISVNKYCHKAPLAKFWFTHTILVIPTVGNNVIKTKSNTCYNLDVSSLSGPYVHENLILPQAPGGL